MQPIVNIDGDKIRRFREAQGLTQLYLATVVEVTTDTISRWENKRSPAIRRENALKLAEALGVTIDELLASVAPEAVTPLQVTAIPVQNTVAEAGSIPPAPSQQEIRVQDAASSPDGVAGTRKYRPVWLGVGLAACLVLVSFFFSGLYPATTLEAVRIMPGHMAPNRPFPVLIRVRGRGEMRNPVLIREELKGRCDSVGLEESPKRFGKTPRWIGRVEDGEATFVYLVHPENGLPLGESIAFSGDVVTRGGEGRSSQVGGPDQVVIMPYHWADEDRDYRISDDEILAVHDTFGGGDRHLPFDELEQLWLAGSYSWNGKDFSLAPPPEIEAENP